MRIVSLLSRREPVFSFEFFPPKTEAGDRMLLSTLADLREMRPDYVSVTYGAGGSTRDRTVELVSYIKNDLGLEAMAHLTCVGASREELGLVLDRLEKAGIENVIALRGDPPVGEESFVPHPEGLSYACELVELIREQKRPFCVAGACYPEKHIEAASMDEDLARLSQKVAAGVDFLITQLFFDNRSYFDFVARARDAGITVPIIAGIMPITNLGQIERFTRRCGAIIPGELHAKLEPYREDSDTVEKLSVDWAVAQCRELLDAGAPGIHFYTLNKSRATRDILARLRS
ncbi:MAG TPA: methylenetetrahydrofolate reductase [NAD(P)H] [Candidatus Limnocylindrales bacterium]|nr:methylenetetrahydrofolate reductase [NAD(P)H] [Candidatus Limnocylindrales bacterium]